MMSFSSFLFADPLSCFYKEKKISVYQDFFLSTLPPPHPLHPLYEPSYKMQFLLFILGGSNEWNKKYRMKITVISFN